MDFKRIARLIGEAIDKECEKILVLGDFGYWPHVNDGKKFLNRLKTYLERYPVELHFVKGNHDNHEFLNEYNGQTCVEIFPKFFFHPNMSVWTWGKYSFCAIGGAYSIDGARRIEGLSKWKDEEISNDDIEKSKFISADIILSHDCPLSVDIDEYLDYKRDSGTMNNRFKLQECVENIKPNLVLHGHYHKRINGVGNHSEGSFTNIGLASNMQKLEEQILVFDCEV